MNPETRIAGNEARRAAGLERAREVLRLHDEGLRGAELAEKLGVAAGSVRSILTRSRRRLGLPTPARLKPMSADDAAALYSAREGCRHVYAPDVWSGIRCALCPGWFCL